MTSGGYTAFWHVSLAKSASSMTSVPFIVMSDFVTGQQIAGSELVERCRSRADGELTWIP